MAVPEVTLREVMIKLGRMYKSDSQAALAHGMTRGQWNRLKAEKAFPTQATLSKLGIKITYEIDHEKLP